MTPLLHCRERGNDSTHTHARKGKTAGTSVKIHTCRQKTMEGFKETPGASTGSHLEEIAVHTQTALATE